MSPHIFHQFLPQRLFRRFLSFGGIWIGRPAIRRLLIHRAGARFPRLRLWLTGLHLRLSRSLRQPLLVAPLLPLTGQAAALTPRAATV